MARITIDGLGVRFDLDRSRRVVTPVLARLRRRGETVWGLRDLDLQADPGDGLALIGPSGSGKTSLLRALAGVLPADQGRIVVEGRIGSLLAVESGLFGILTGRENALTLAVLAGLPLEDAHAALDRLRERSGLGEAFERPVATYSEGMRARLGFVAAEAAAPDVLLLDEVFEALDHAYRVVVEEQVRALRERGGIVIAAGHDHEALARICDQGVVLEAGAVIAEGAFRDVAGAYRARETGAEPAPV